MKKMLYLCGAILMIVTSCSNDDNNNSSNSTSSVLVKKRLYVGSDGTLYNSADCLYDGNKILSITEADGSILKYTYTGDVITKIEEIDENGELNLTTVYNYSNGKLATSIDKNIGDSNYYKTTYTHNTDGSVSYEEFKGVVSTGIEQEYGATGKYTFKGGNLIKLEVFYYGSESSYIYEYDTKNHPFKNVLGFNLLLDEDVSVNNLVKETSISGSGNNIRTAITSYTYKYDKNNYPTEKVESYQNGSSTSTETSQFVY